MKDHVLKPVLTQAFPHTTFSFIEDTDTITLKWLDGPTIEQVGAYLNDEKTELPDLGEKSVSGWMRGYSSQAINKALQILAKQTATPLGSPTIVETSVKHGFYINDESPVDVDGQIAPLKVAIRGILDAEDLTINNVVSAVTVERWNGNLSLSMPKKSGGEIRFAFGPTKAKMILQALSEIQKYVRDAKDEQDQTLP